MLWFREEYLLPAALVGVGVIEKHEDAAVFYLIHGAFQVRMIEHIFCYQLSFSALTYGVLPFSPSWFAAGIIDFRP
jgi:hypothetical protein